MSARWCWRLGYNRVIRPVAVRRWCIVLLILLFHFR
ncbi:hypothetical protein LSH36_618g01012 [Paralvinella palmiformis]|uniref:Uncharacterized protein n=1 Tax=Paralvinella palmiformis TaxID=53620 RepID=A0AAD9MX64_9ANNE|nr:hypothetical protein LSH36_618g01012 [Paralvinella palmiformis]